MVALHRTAALEQHIRLVGWHVSEDLADENRNTIHEWVRDSWCFVSKGFEVALYLQDDHDKPHDELTSAVAKAPERSQQ